MRLPGEVCGTERLWEMIAIINRGKKGKLRRYEVKINEEHICEFTHKRSDGLAVCLEKAAKAVRMQRAMDVWKFLVDSDTK